MKRSLISALTLLVLLTACGGDDPTGSDDDDINLPNGTFSGTVNGSRFNAASAVATWGGNIVGFGAGDLQSRVFAFAIFASAPGTFTLSSTIGNNSTYQEGGAAWIASAATPGSSGSLTITTLSSSRVVGSFTITLVPSQGGASGNRTVAGSFDLDNSQ